ncbi:lantibiotic dehydratase [Nonomuraea gerenzanensis]|uniref:Uncharacterized protein n=1 Tax=Nonomuraea gerenzanensis TaxID=93944 RepID=A0A1M4EHR9_9ACTN|nr:lantibiotic dehydratase [Nonomuraea gerenzanensis]UBU09696.1 lantibiotic dehydratase family protein [Nonomuraea gerenzanensis]SBO98133.1 hypothetical protein BN4615_P7649 [Nonomuraea gerenzanensis]
MDTEHDWTLLPAVVVRSAGFPWELVMSLVYPRAAETAAAVVRLERRALDLLTGSPAPGAGASGGQARGGRLPRGLRSRLRDLRPLPDGTPGPAEWLTAWNEVTGRLEEARLTLSGLVSGDAALGRAAVAGVMADERFLDALVCTAPALYRDLRRGAKGGRTRRELADQVQRLSASCETAGCYGPISYGAVRAGERSGHTWAGAHAYTRRVAFPAARVVEALQQRVLAEPALVAGLVPRRKTWAGEVLDGAAFVGHCDGERTLAEIASATGAGVERASAALAVAVRRGLLTHDLCPPATVCDTLGWLRDRLAARGVPVAARDRGRPGIAPDADDAEPPGDLRHGRVAAAGDCECGCAEGRPGSEEDPGVRDARTRGPQVPRRAFVSRPGVPAQRARAIIGARPAQDADLPLGTRVGEIDELLAQYPRASPDVKLAVQRRVEALAGSGRRDDRAIVHEAAAGTLRLTVGDGPAADLQGRVPRVLDLLAEEAELTRQRTNRLLAGRLGPGTYELAEVLRSTGDLEIEHGDRLAGRIAALVREAPGDLTELNLAGLLDEPVPPAAPVLCSADVMVAAPALEAYEPGVTPLVLGRLHDAVLLTPWALQFHEERAACLAERDSEIRRVLSGFTVLNVISRRTNGVPPLELPGPVLELGGVAADPRRRRIGLDELYVHSDGQRAVLHAKGMEEPLLLHNGDHDTALHTAFALPRVRLPRLPGLSRVPRLTWDNVVVSRRTWRLGRGSFEALAQAGDDRELLVAMARLRDSHGLPEAFFASTARERRSLYVDMRSPALLEGLARLAAPAEQVTLTEVFPGPGECWLRDGERRFAAELRCVYLRPAGSPALGGDGVAAGGRAGRPDAAGGQDGGGGPRPGVVLREGPARRSAEQSLGRVRRVPGPAQQPVGSGRQVSGPVALPSVQQHSGPAASPSAQQHSGPVIPHGQYSHGAAVPRWLERLPQLPDRRPAPDDPLIRPAHPYPWPGEGG